MNCWHCKNELIWCSDFDIGHESENYTMLTSLHCPKCGTDVDVYLPKETEGKDDE